MDCIFCKIIKKEIPSKIIYEDDLVIAMLDINPINNGHTLIIPKKHYTDIMEATDILDYMFKIAKDLTPKLMNKLNTKSLTYLINYGDDQQVKHLHLHLIPNYLEKNKNIKDVDTIYQILK